VPALLETAATVAEKGGRPGLLSSACVALGKIGVASTDLPELYRMLKFGTPNSKYTDVVRAFAGAPAEAVPDLLALVSSADPVASHRAAHALGAMGPRAKDAVPALTAALRRESSDIRSAAAFALGDIGVSDVAAIAALRGLQQDTDAATRSAAETALFKLNPSTSRDGR
jgi:hypothetical protein